MSRWCHDVKVVMSWTRVDIAEINFLKNWFISSFLFHNSARSVTMEPMAPQKTPMTHRVPSWCPSFYRNSAAWCALFFYQMWWNLWWSLQHRWEQGLPKPLTTSKESRVWHLIPIEKAPFLSKGCVCIAVLKKMALNYNTRLSPRTQVALFLEESIPCFSIFCLAVCKLLSILSAMSGWRSVDWSVLTTLFSLLMFSLLEETLV